MGKSSANKPAVFFTRTIWEMDPDAYGGFRHYAAKYIQILAYVLRNFWDDNCMLRASALSFTTILSLVPFFALTFAVLKGLGVQNTIEPYILEEVTAGSEELVDRIITYINNTNMGSVGAIGLATLVITVITLLGNIEEAFNVIWGVKETRSYYRKYSDYLSVLVTGPLLILAAVSVTTSLQSQSVVKWLLSSPLGGVVLFFFRLMPYVSVWLALFFLYMFIPNTKVRIKSAFIGGILAGTIWQIAQWGYLHFQVGVAKYNAIYGTLALLPILMVWIYTSWMIVLFGVEVVCAHQNIKTFRREFHSIHVSFALAELLTMSILKDIGTSFHYGTPPLSLEGISEKLDIPVRLVREVIERLTETGYLVAIAGEDRCYQPGRDLDQIRITDVLATIRDYGTHGWVNTVMQQERELQEILSRAHAVAASTLEGKTLKDMVMLSAP